MRFDQVARVIVNADHSIMSTAAVYRVADCINSQGDSYATSRAAAAALQRQATTIVKIVRVIATGSHHFAVAVRRAKASESRSEAVGIIADNLHKAGWSLGWVSALERNASQDWRALPAN